MKQLWNFDAIGYTCMYVTGDGLNGADALDNVVFSPAGVIRVVQSIN